MNHKVEVGGEEECSRTREQRVLPVRGRGRKQTAAGEVQARETAISRPGSGEGGVPSGRRVRRGCWQRPLGAVGRKGGRLRLGRVETVVGLAARRVVGACRRVRPLAVKYEGRGPVAATGLTASQTHRPRRGSEPMPPGSAHVTSSVRAAPDFEARVSPPRGAAVTSQAWAARPLRTLLALRVPKAGKIWLLLYRWTREAPWVLSAPIGPRPRTSNGKC